jgi:protein subunit release factor B
MINFGVTERKRREHLGHKLERRMDNCDLLENDIEEKFVRSSGAGGQTSE